VNKFSPDKWHEPFVDPATGRDTWFNLPENNQSWMSDHLHPQACKHEHCDIGERATQLLGDWRGITIAPNGDLWVGGRWAAGAIIYTADNTNWYNNPRDPITKASAFSINFGDPYDGNCSNNRPIFCAPLEGDPVNLSAIAFTKDGKTWFSSGSVYNDPTDVNYGIASWEQHPKDGGPQYRYYDPMRDLGMTESNVRDMVALPDGRLVVAAPNGGLVFWDPTGKTRPVAMRAGQGIPSDQVLRVQLDMMVDPPALQVATAGGATVLRKFPSP
jgi:hypothetical protein